MTKILACIDGSPYAASVADCAAWAAKGLGGGVELLQVLGRREAAAENLSGRVVPDGQRQLLERLAGLDAERFRLLQQSARLGLEEAKARMLAAGVAEVTTSLRTGDVLEEISAREAEADLLVIGKRGEAAAFARAHLGSNLERIVRMSRLPILIAALEFKPVQRALVAFDGRSNALKALDALSRLPLARGIEALILTAGKATEEARRQLAAAEALLRAGGLVASGRIEEGEPAAVISAAVETEDVDLLVMGAYGHSRLRSLAIGSTTTELIRACRIPALVFR